MTDPERNKIIDIRVVQLKRHAQQLAPLGLIDEVTRFYDPSDRLELNMIYLLKDEVASLDQESEKTKKLVKIISEFRSQMKRTYSRPLFLQRSIYDQVKAEVEAEGWDVITAQVE